MSGNQARKDNGNGSDIYNMAKIDGRQIKFGFKCEILCHGYGHRISTKMNKRHGNNKNDEDFI